MRTWTSLEEPLATSYVLYTKSHLHQRTSKWTVTRRSHANDQWIFVTHAITDDQAVGMGSETAWVPEERAENWWKVWFAISDQKDVELDFPTGPSARSDFRQKVASVCHSSLRQILLTGMHIMNHQCSLPWFENAKNQQV